MEPYKPENLPLKLDWLKLFDYVGDAHEEVGRFDGILQGIINPDVLLSPLTTQEAVLSSRIEGTQASLEEVLFYEASPSPNDTKKEDIQEIINYRDSVNFAVEWLQTKPITLNLMREIHSILLNSVRGRNRARGEFRKIQNFIGPDSKIEHAIYVPPSPEQLMSYLDNLEKYIHFEEKDRLIQIAIVHAQFELIHPFLDGNGRLGRILIPLFLYEKKVLRKPMFYLSSFFEKNRITYFDKLDNVSRNKQWEEWIIFFLTAVAEQAKDNNHKASEILKLYNQMKNEISDIIKSQYSIQTLDSIFSKPILSPTEFANISKIPKASAFRIIEKLREKEILESLREGKGRQTSVLKFVKLYNIIG